MSLLNVIILSLSPISELRGAIPVGIAQGNNVFVVLFLAILANSLIVPLLFFFLDNLHNYFYKINAYRKLFDIYIGKNRHMIEDKIGTKIEFIFLVLFTGVPLPFTGAYTATILAWFFGVERKKAYLAIILGVLVAGIIVTLASLGLFFLF